MKKIFVTLMAALFMIAMVSCKTVDKKKECGDTCMSAKTACMDKATDAKTKKVDAKKKAACDAAFKTCGDDCVKKYGK